MEVLELISPKVLKDVVGNKIQIQFFKKVLNDENYPSKIVLLIGPHGCGKSTISRLVFQDLDFNVFHISGSSSKDLIILITSFLRNRTIDSFLGKKKKKIIFIDNIDALMMTERNIIGVLTDVYPLLEQYKVFIVITCKNNEEKKILDLKTKVEPIKINYPPIKDAFHFLSKANDDHEFNWDEDKILGLVQKYKGSIRDAILNMYVEDADRAVSTVFKDLSPFEIVNKLLRNHHTLTELEYLDEISMVSFLLYENLPDELYTNYDKTNVLTTYANANKYYIYSSQMEEHIYQSVEWSFYELVNLLKVFSINVHLKDEDKNKLMKDVKYRFSQVLSKISHKNIMNKKLSNICEVNGLSRYEVLMLTDKISKDKNIITDGVKSGRKYEAEECNFINTYQKYWD